MQKPLAIRKCLRRTDRPTRSCKSFSCTRDSILPIQVLEKVHLRDKVSELGGLDAEVPEGGTCFSVGQKQLLCLARAINKQTKILCVDEGEKRMPYP